MEERLVDVLNDKNNVLHVFPVTVETRDTPPKDVAFEQEALKAAVAEEIVPETDAEKCALPLMAAATWVSVSFKAVV